MCGIDFNALEDRIDALKTKDTNKLKVYIDGYDGHCLRAYAYFGNQMPDIELAASNEQCYTVKVGNELIDVKETQLIRYKGQILTGKQLYEQIHKVKP